MRLFSQVKLILLLGVIAIFCVGADAQTSRGKAKPLATPPVLTGAEIISRAGTEPDIVPVLQPVEQPAEKPLTTNAARLRDLSERVNKLESGQRSTYDEKQKRLLLNLDILTRAEQRSESLRKQLFEMIEKENTISARVGQIDFDSRPEMIERSLQLAGSMKPEDVRDNRKKSLATERANLQSLLTEIQATRANLNTNLQKAEIMVEKLRFKLEKDIDDSFLKEEVEN